MSLNGFSWNQAELEGFDPLNNGIVTLLAFNPLHSPKPIGTAFIVAAYGNSAVAITAAHNFKDVQDKQNSRNKHHSTALPEFLPETTILDLDRKKVRAICFEDGKIEVSVIAWAMIDIKFDIAIFSIILQNNKDTTFFKTAFTLEDTFPNIGDEVSVLGYADMKIPHEKRNGTGQEKFQLARQLILRCGKVTQVHLDGHILCRGPCIETSIPVFHGMSGGPVMILGKSGEPIKPFGLVSTDLETDEEINNDRSVSGSSIIALLKPGVNFDAEGQRIDVLKLNSAYYVGNT